ncbi:MAG: hypothetical protein AAB462_02975 [Patescibacteria group bacterium]
MKVQVLSSAPRFGEFVGKPLHIIYIPGIGDQNVDGQQKAVNTWSWYGVTAEICQMNWGDKLPWQPKLDKLLATIDKSVSEGRSVGLVGVSAGASAAINAFAARKGVITGVVCIAGKINHPETIGDNYLHNNPALLTSVQDCIPSLRLLNASDRKRILSRHGLFDETVPKRDSYVQGARNRYTPSAFHILIIAFEITLGAPSFIHFLKKQTKSN